eukprot:NODE_7802_length_384_cov_100.014925_g6102_i0.p2 GENE.NODE_7802_length_384_cov_100.014925_g6102_i0~~NODE_7802_length_384_cov_100.014925_g6102_i0.p2  ORF type:complete len:92 (-),score=54.74 NODE_7802_length_384_cov_100.014925_g6102_i0:109-354(-)
MGVGGILVERTVAEVLPAVDASIDNMNKLLGQLNEALAAKAKAISEHVTKYDIKVKGSQEIETKQSAGGGDEQKRTGGVLA